MKKQKNKRKGILKKKGNGKGVKKELVADKIGLTLAANTLQCIFVIFKELKYYACSLLGFQSLGA